MIEICTFNLLSAGAASAAAHLFGVETADAHDGDDEDAHDEDDEPE